MTLSLKPSHVRRYAEIGKLLWKYSRSDIFHTRTLTKLRCSCFCPAT